MPIHLRATTYSCCANNKPLECYVYLPPLFLAKRQQPALVITASSMLLCCCSRPSLSLASALFVRVIVPLKTAVAYFPPCMHNATFTTAVLFSDGKHQRVLSAGEGAEGGGAEGHAGQRRGGRVSRRGERYSSRPNPDGSTRSPIRRKRNYCTAVSKWSKKPGFCKYRGTFLLVITVVCFVLCAFGRCVPNERKLLIGSTPQEQQKVLGCAMPCPRRSTRRVSNVCARRSFLFGYF